MTPADGAMQRKELDCVGDGLGNVLEAGAVHDNVIHIDVEVPASPALVEQRLRVPKPASETFKSRELQSGENGIAIL